MNIIKSIRIEMLLWQLKMSPLVRKIRKNSLKKALKTVIIILSLLLELFGLAFILFWYLILCLIISLALSYIVLLFIDYDAQQKTQLVQVITAMLALIGVLFNIQSHDKKEYKTKKRIVYLNLIKYLKSQLHKIRSKQKIDEFLNSDEILIYSSKAVINLLADINNSSIDISSDDKISEVIEKIAYLIDIIRVEVSYFSDFTYFANRFSRVDYIDVMDNINCKKIMELLSKEIIKDTEKEI